MKIALITLIALTFLSCEKFETSANTDAFYHVSSAGFELPVWIKGNTASNKFVVFINGGPGLTSIDIASADMLGWGESLEKEFAMVYYDQRGTGNAQGAIPDESITIEQYLDDLEAVISSVLHHYPSAKIFLMGHSFGGFIGHAGDGVIPEENTNLSGKGLLSIVFSSSYNIFPAYLSSNGTKVGELLFENIKGTDLLPELYNIKLPSLMLWGKYDDIIPPQLGSTAFDALGTNLDEKEFVLFEKSGHQPFLNEIELFESTVIKFVNEH
jgi:pimeloyl-ACP methyl ester carboxylesterase